MKMAGVKRLNNYFSDTGLGVALLDSGHSGSTLDCSSMVFQVLENPTVLA
jgi:hypothetical protein